MLFQIPLLAYIGALSSMVVVIVGVRRYKTLRTEMRILLAFFVLSLLINLFSFVFAYRLGSNLWLYHFITLLEFSALVLVFSFWQKSKKLSHALRATIVAFFFVWVLAKLLIEDLRQFDNYSSSFGSVFLVGIASYILVTLYKDDWQKPGKDFRFWVLSAVLIYYATNVILTALSNEILNLPQQQIVDAWSIQWFIGIVANGLYLVAFLCKQPRLLFREPSFANSFA